MKWKTGACLLWLGCLLGSSTASAEAVRIDRSAERMRVDGALREWKGAHFTYLGQGDDAALRFAIASTDAGFFVGAEVSDDQLVLKDKPGAGQDALVLSLALPDARGALRISEIWLHPGRAGKQKAMADVKGPGAAKAGEVQVVEGPRAQGAGFVLEAFIPFAVVGGGELWEQGRAVLRYDDVDKPGAKQPETTLATGKGSPSDWPRIGLGAGQADLLGSFLAEKSLSGVEPRFDQRANVAGDETLERVLIVDKYVLVYGSAFNRGESYVYAALPYGMGGGLVSAELVDVTGDGRAELLARVRQRNELGAREILGVFALEETGVGSLFAIETKKEAKGGFIESTFSLDRHSKPARIQVAIGRAQGLDALTYQETSSRDALSILLPWGPIESRTYAYQDGKFTVVAEKARKGAGGATGAPAAPAAPASSSTSASDVAAAPVGQPAPTSELGKLILRSPAPGSLRFDREVNVAGGELKERIFAHERQIVVTGPDLGPAPTYVAYAPPIARPEDLLALDAADVTGDKWAELLVRYRMKSGEAEHELLLVLRVDPPAQGTVARRLTPLLLAEVARRRGADAILNEVQTKGGTLSIAPGRAQGFREETYPFHDQASPDIERLLLPWRDKPRRYRFDGARLRAE